MRPDDTNSNQGGRVPGDNRAALQVPDDRRTVSSLVPDRTQSAAADVVRGQIDAIYQTDPNAQQQVEVAVEVPAYAGQAETASPYDRSHSEARSVQASDWQQYHSAWQDYYQEYYKRYYAHHVAQQQASKPAEQATGTFPLTKEADDSQKLSSGELSRTQAIRELKDSIKQKVVSSAKKARKSRHFIPIVAAVCVVLMFVFLQYNRTIFATVAAYIAPGNVDPQNVIVDPSAAGVQVGTESKLIIPKTNVDVPIQFGVGNDYNSQMDAMSRGVAQFAIPGANAMPGQVGNLPIAGHSSNDLLDGGDYKFIFAQNEKLEKGDIFYVHYGGTRYTYTITRKEVVMPNEVGKLVYQTDKPNVTLITCVPLGTALKRLLITAEQISPDPAAAKKAETSNAPAGEASIPGNSPTLLERMFGGGR